MAESTGGSTQAARIAKIRADAELIFPKIKEKFADAVVEEQTDDKNSDPFIVVDGKSLREICQFLRDEDELQFDLLSLISTVDYLPGDEEEGRIEVVYFLDSTEHRHRVQIKVRLDRNEPALPSVSVLWRAADWHEREAYDLMGVRFEDHPNLVRILCAEDWEGHPLRKDYEIPETYHGVKNIIY